jgi:hypothetical protein
MPKIGHDRETTTASRNARPARPIRVFDNVDTVLPPSFPRTG